MEGIPVSAGIAIGEAFVYSKDFVIPNYTISDFQINIEIDRFRNALEQTKKEFIVLKNKIIKEMSEDEGKFLDSHIMIIEDKSIIKEVEEKLNKEKKNVEWVFYQVVDSLVKKFNKMNDEYFRDRAVDLLDIGRKVMQKLMTKKNISLSSLEKDVIIISTDISVSDTASMNKKHVMGFITEYGGRTSHVSILAKALGIPSVVGIPNIIQKVYSGDLLILDGIKGHVIVNPPKDKLDEYKKIKEEYEKKENQNLLLKDVPAETLDGKKIVMKANMEIPEQEIDFVNVYGAEGIGLYRSEFLYLSKKNKLLPSEEQQFNAYKFILEAFPDKPVTIRTLDLGGDKILDSMEKELNPYLGWRAIRLCLARPDIFKTQLRALYRASIFGNLQIMFPMITGLEELEKAKKIIIEVKKELKKDGIKFNDNVPIGIMIETPAAVMMSDVLAKFADFISIGTNDLIQYTLACDRGNEKVAYLYEPLHPAVLRLIKIIVDNAHIEGKKVSLCGEMATEIDCIPALLGLDIDELSMTSISIPDVKNVIRNIKYSEAKNLVIELLQMDTFDNSVKKVKTWMRKNLKFNYNY
jgi:phosphotransferase system enzyme I (PtsI)